MIPVLLVGGAIINIAVAWGLVHQQRSGICPLVLILDDLYPSYYRNNYAPGMSGDLITWITPAADETLVRRVGANVTYSQRYRAAVRRTADPNTGVDTRITAGWPQLSVGSVWSPQRTLGASLKAPRAWDRIPAMPVFPIWPGFATNTIFYAAILGLILFTPRVIGLRRRLRIKRGQCPACGYPIGTSDVCTECGRPVKGRNAESQKAETA
jgi:hypothetical protein